MTQIALNSDEIVKAIDDKQMIEKGGFKVMRLPKKSIHLPDNPNKTEFFAYEAIVNYNKHKERQHRQNKFNQKVRTIKRYAKAKRLRQSGLTFTTDVIGGLKS